MIGLISHHDVLLAGLWISLETLFFFFFFYFYFFKPAPGAQPFQEVE
jgi:hypothetical protein